MTADDLLKKGLSLLRENNTLGALTHFEKAYAIKKTPLIQSYTGLCIALERGKITEAIAFLNDAMAKEPDNPVHYLNLGRVYLKAGRKIDAIDTFRKGLSFGENAEIHMILDRLGLRRKPVFPFLPRGSFLNRYIGLLLHKMKLR